VCVYVCVCAYMCFKVYNIIDWCSFFIASRIRHQTFNDLAANPNEDDHPQTVRDYNNDDNNNNNNNA